MQGHAIQKYADRTIILLYSKGSPSDDYALDESDIWRDLDLSHVEFWPVIKHLGKAGYLGPANRAGVLTLSPQGRARALELLRPKR